LWNRALTATEVNGLFGGTAPQDGLVAEYLLGRDVAVDSVGVHNGVIVGGTWAAA
jgi:hypothetical protein